MGFLFGGVLCTGEQKSGVKIKGRLTDMAWEACSGSLTPTPPSKSQPPMGRKRPGLNPSSCFTPKPRKVSAFRLPGQGDTVTPQPMGSHDAWWTQSAPMDFLFRTAPTRPFGPSCVRSFLCFALQMCLRFCLVYLSQIAILCYSRKKLVFAGKMTDWFTF